MKEQVWWCNPDGMRRVLPLQLKGCQWVWECCRDVAVYLQASSPPYPPEQSQDQNAQ